MERNLLLAHFEILKYIYLRYICISHNKTMHNFYFHADKKKTITKPKCLNSFLPACRWFRYFDKLGMMMSHVRNDLLYHY